MRPTREAPVRLRRSPRKQLGNLGDTDTATDDDEPGTSQFRTPSQLPELTDYELNYSASPEPNRKQIANDTSSSGRGEVFDYEEESNDDSDNLELLAPMTTSPTTQKSVHRRKQSSPIRREQREQNFLLDVRKLQMRTDFLIPRLPFSRLIREIMVDTSDSVNRITTTALEALQTCSEMYLEQRLHDAYLLTLHRGRVTLEVRDMILINFLRHNSN